MNLDNLAFINNFRKAIKQMKLNKISLNIEEVKNEAKIMASLFHPFIVKYFNYFINENYFHIVSEFCEVKESFFKDSNNVKDIRIKLVINQCFFSIV